MELTVKDRLLITAILPKEDNAVTLRIIRGLKEKLAFTPEEHEFLQIREEAGGTRWSDEYADYATEIEITDLEEPIIKRSLKQLDREQKLPMIALDLYERFVE